MLCSLYFINETNVEATSIYFEQIFSCCLFFKFKSCISLSNKKANKERVRAKLSRIEYTKTSETIFYVRIDPSKPIF